tara:strand:+ start:36942 stop:37331 length:390 start_codon:yes stop_codon:yes gene_type:complete
MKALILDDSRTDAYVAAQTASEFFSDVEVCGTPVEFKKSISMVIPDIIFMDIHIGDLHNGISLIDEIRHQDSDISLIPVIVVTASNDEKLHKFALDSGATAVMTKPLLGDKLRPLLHQYIPGYQDKIAI